MLEVKDLEVYYGMIQAIKGISFEVNQGEVVALIGANGAGKTTTLHTITCLLYTSIGPLGHGVGVCEGIAKSVKVLCDVLGIWCMIAVCGNNPEKGCLLYTSRCV